MTYHAIDCAMIASDVKERVASESGALRKQLKLLKNADIELRRKRTTPGSFSADSPSGKVRRTEGAPLLQKT